MLVIDPHLAQKFETLLVLHDVPINQRSNFYKWLRYYLDFCDKYQLEPSEKLNFLAFDEKLCSKDQSEAQRQQAKRAVTIYYRGIVGHSIASQKIKTASIKEVNLQKGNINLNEMREIKPNPLLVKETLKISNL